MGVPWQQMTRGRRGRRERRGRRGGRGRGRGGREQKSDTAPSNSQERIITHAVCQRFCLHACLLQVSPGTHWGEGGSTRRRESRRERKRRGRARDQRQTEREPETGLVDCSHTASAPAPISRSAFSSLARTPSSSASCRAIPAAPSSSTSLPSKAPSSAS